MTPARRAERRANAGVEGNERLTAVNAAVLLVLLAAEGFTILGVRQMLTLHVFIGMVLVPPVLLKIGSTVWRFARYYGGTPAYRRKGPPPILLRMLGPVLIVLTLVLLASGAGLLLVSPAQTPFLLKAHKASGRRDVTDAGIRQWLIAASLVAGALLGLVLLSRVGPWMVTR